MSTNTETAIRNLQKDEKEANRFIGKNRRFILASAYHAAGHFITESDDEYSVAMIAFYEAICSYDTEKGPFYAFASLVIRRRICDYLRTEARRSPEICIRPDALTTEEEPALFSGAEREARRKEAEISMRDAAARPESTPIRDEIEAVQNILRRYGFSFFDLTGCSPKAEKTKKACAKAICCLVQDPRLLESMRRGGVLPAKQLRKETGVSAKILERHRKYIIAAAEILDGDYPGLADYMREIRKEMRERS